MSESVQWAILTPMVLLILLGSIQVGMLLSGRSAVRDAAMAAAEVMSLTAGGSAAGGSAGGGSAAERVARDVATDAGLTDVQVRTSTQSRTLTVTVTGRLPLLLTLTSPTLTASATVGRHIEEVP